MSSTTYPGPSGPGLIEGGTPPSRPCDTISKPEQWTAVVKDHNNQHVMLTVLPKLNGEQKAKPTRYALGQNETEALLAPLALFDLLPGVDRPGSVLALCTPEAEQDSWPLLEQQWAGHHKPRLIKVSSGNSQDHINAYLNQVTHAILMADAKEITIDVTHGFRHFSFLTYMAVLYISELRPLQVRGAYYGLLCNDTSSPFLDLRPLLELPKWIHALHTLADTGSAMPMAKILSDHSQGQFTKQIKDKLEHFSEAYLSGLPLELGRQASMIQEERKHLHNWLSNTYKLPLANQLSDQIDNVIKDFTLDNTLALGKDGWKRKIPLTKGELKRQTSIINNLLAHGHVATALRLMREWIVSWVVYCQGHDKDKWLEKEARRPAANLINAIEAVRRNQKLKDVLSEDQLSLGLHWGLLRDLRNGFAHQGMNGNALIGIGGDKTQKEIDKIKKFWKETLCKCPTMHLSFDREPGYRVLISPIGMRPGVLFSALKSTLKDGEVNLCLVVCSQETELYIKKAIDHASYSGRVEPLCLKDPYGSGGLREIKKLEGKVSKHFVGAAEVVVNITGGTTLMQLAVERLAVAARRLACPVRRFGLIDRRSAEEQRRDPWQEGEPFWLEGDDDGA